MRRASVCWMAWVLITGCGGGSSTAENDGSSSESSGQPTTTGDPDSSTSSSAGTEADTSSSSGPAAVCGDGMVDGAELCDDGNEIDDDDCRNDCTVPPCALAWEVAIEVGDVGQQSIAQVARDGAGDLVMVGTITDLDGKLPPSMWVAKYDAAGTEIWSGTRGPEGAIGNGIAVDEAGTIYVVAEAPGENGDLDGFAIAIAGDGTEGWTVPIAGPMPEDDRLTGVAVGGDGDVIVNGTIRDTESSSDAVIARLAAADGATVWLQQLTGTTNPDTGYSFDQGGHVAIDPGGDLVVSWSSYVDFDSTLGSVSRLAAADGTTVWDAGMLGGSANDREETSESIAIGPDGGIVVDFADCRGSGCFTNIYMLASDGTGAELYDLAALAAPTEDPLFADGVHFDDAGNMVLGGNYEDSEFDEFRAWIARIAPDGTVICQGRHDYPDEMLASILTSSLAIGPGDAPILCGGLQPAEGFTPDNTFGPMWLGSFSP